MGSLRVETANQEAFGPEDFGRCLLGMDEMRKQKNRADSDCHWLRLTFIVIMS
jgi:hypothetical protein